MKTPSYIKAFMGADFRNTEGVSLRILMSDLGNKETAKMIKRASGCYVISATNRKYTYANSKESPIIYIGLSNNLWRRIYQDHYLKHYKRLAEDSKFCQRNNVWMAAKYQYMIHGNARVDIFYCKGKQEQKEFEANLLWNFYLKYDSLPIGNGARSFSQK